METGPSAEAYEQHVGRWSRRIAAAFVDSTVVAAGGRWLDVGCGTGALTEAVLAAAEPAAVAGVDSAPPLVAYARRRTADSRATFAVADARALPVADAAFDAVVSGLALNFVAEPARAVAEWRRVARPGAVVAAYVWDYADGMALMRWFWEAAAELDPALGELDERQHFPLCRPEPLSRLWTDAGLSGVVVRTIGVPAALAGFDDYWSPFLCGLGPGYAARLPADHVRVLRELLRARLPMAAAGSITQTARAWAVRGSVPRR
ncbi:MAG TPA: class I SAM-dependent methyltransferase [Amycolatopsis sp.]|nr:class I SAM-dependent methyltransferase [Amycolatopsis sp.]